MTNAEKMSAAMNTLANHKKKKDHVTTSRIIARNDLFLAPHTWSEGLDYEIVEKSDRFTLASNEGQCNFYSKDKNKVMEHFQKEETS